MDFEIGRIVLASFDDANEVVEVLSHPDSQGFILVKREEKDDERVHESKLQVIPS
jgi:hypothetical protein